MHTDYLYKKENKIIEQEIQKNKDKFPLLKVNYNSEGQNDGEPHELTQPS